MLLSSRLQLQACGSRIIRCDGEQFDRGPRAAGHGRRNRKERTRQRFDRTVPGPQTLAGALCPTPEVLDPGLSTWIDALARLEQTETEDYPPDISQRLIYLLYVAPRAVGVPYLIVRPTSVRLLKDGRFSDKTALSIQRTSCNRMSRSSYGPPIATSSSASMR